MAHSKSALKRWRQNEAHRARNKPVRSAARTAVRTAHAAAESGNADHAIREASRVLDRAAKRRVIHPNAASRYKSRLMRHRNRAAGPAATGAPAKRAAAPKRRAAAKPRASTTRTRSSKAKE